MSILVVHPSLNASGGSEKVCLTIIEALKEKGYKIILGSFERTDWQRVERIFGEVAKPDVEIINPRIFGTSAYGELLNFFLLLSHIPKNKNYETAVISCSSPWFFCPSADKTVIYMNLAPVNYIKGVRRAYLLPYISIQRKFLKKVKNKIILTNSTFSSKVIENVYSLKSKIVYPPVDVKRFQISQNKENLVISVGRFDTFKNYEILIKAFSHIEDGKCFIIGTVYDNASIKYLYKLRKLVKVLKLNGKVKFVVNSSMEVLKNFLLKAKVYVHTALHEYFGISIVEAMACGCVPIVRKSGGPFLDIVEQGKYGLVFENIDELADQINLLLQDENTLKNLSQKAIKRASFFNKENFKKNFLEIIFKNNIRQNCTLESL
jgi:glycosyltransferase involved in cell wall biosynthesis